jgi:hypothetical protein
MGNNEWVWAGLMIMVLWVTAMIAGVGLGWALVFGVLVVGCFEAQRAVNKRRTK